MRFEYAWLTGPRLARERTPNGGYHPTAFILRYGMCASIGRELGFSIADCIGYIKAGGRRFYLASVDVNGVPLSLDQTIFLPWLIDGIVVSDNLLGRLRNVLDMGDDHVVAIDPRYVAAHAWHYRLPPTPDDCAYDHYLARQVDAALDLEGELPAESVMMRGLCERYPSPRPLPQMHVILASWFYRSEVVRQWHGDEIVITTPPGTRMKTSSGDVPGSDDYWRSGPIVDHDGFLLPRAAAALLGVQGSTCVWPQMTCVKPVVIETAESG